MTAEPHQPSVQQTQTELAAMRTVLALDRTLLAWVRTSLSLNAFGFTLAKFVHSLVIAGNLHIDAQCPRLFGITLMALGILGLLFGIFDYRRSVSRLQNSVKIPSMSSSLFLSVLLVIVSILLMIDIIVGLCAQAA